MVSEGPLVGVLALQGGFQAHERMLLAEGARVRQVRIPGDLQDLDGLVFPGGESTAMTLGIERDGLATPLRALVQRGVPVLASCAGMIMLDRDHLGLMDIATSRNAFGRQVHSFETQLSVDGFGEPPVRAIFIRAPWISEHGDQVRVLATLDGHPVAARQQRMLAVAFHTELTDDRRLHNWLVKAASGSEAQ